MVMKIYARLLEAKLSPLIELEKSQNGSRMLLQKKETFAVFINLEKAFGIVRRKRI